MNIFFSLKKKVTMKKNTLSDPRTSRKQTNKNKTLQQQHTNTYNTVDYSDSPIFVFVVIYLRIIFVLGVFLFVLIFFVSAPFFHFFNTILILFWRIFLSLTHGAFFLIFCCSDSAQNFFCFYFRVHFCLRSVNVLFGPVEMRWEMTVEKRRTVRLIQIVIVNVVTHTHCSAHTGCVLPSPKQQQKREKHTATPKSVRLMRPRRVRLKK